MMIARPCSASATQIIRPKTINSRKGSSSSVVQIDWSARAVGYENHSELQMRRRILEGTRLRIWEDSERRLSIPAALYWRAKVIRTEATRRSRAWREGIFRASGDCGSMSIFTDWFRRMATNKIITVAIIAVLVILIIAVIVSKFR